MLMKEMTLAFGMAWSFGRDDVAVARRLSCGAGDVSAKVGDDWAAGKSDSFLEVAPSRRHDAHQLDAVAFGQCVCGPFFPPQGEAIVFDKSGRRG